MDRFMFYSLGVLTSLCLCAFTFLLVLDVRSSFHKQASWIPGKSLPLGAVTIQLLAFVAGTNMNLLEDEKQQNFHEWLTNRFVVAACKLNVCVFLGYFYTGMVSPRSPDNLAAITVLLTGLYFPLKNFISGNGNQDHKEKYSPLWGAYFRCQQILFICITFLILLLGCTVIAGITVRRILKERISAILVTVKDEEVQPSTKKDERISCSWNEFEDELFKSWIVARVCQPDYVIARSVLSSAVGLVVTFCVLSCTLTCVIDSGFTYIFIKPVRLLLFTLFVFVLEQWVVICCRWYSSLLVRKRCFCFEDFWTRALSEKIDMYDLQNWRPTSNYSREISLTRIATLLRLHKLLYFLCLLQILVVLGSKFSWLLSEIVLGKILQQCHKHTRYWRQRIHPTSSRYRYESYSPILQRLCMPGEDPSDLWKANKRAINRISLLLKEGRDDGSISNSLFTPFSLDWADQGFQLVDKLQKSALPQVVEYFPNSEKQCWKITVVSLTLFMIKLSRQVKSDRLSNAFKACNQAWDLLSFLDKSDSPSEADSFDRGTDKASLAADKEFSRLRLSFSNLHIVSEESAREINIKTAKNFCPEAVKKIKNVLGEIQGREKGDTHSKDWIRIAPGYNIYKLCKVMENELEIDKMEDLEAQSEVDVAEDLIAWAESSLRSVIAACVCMVPDMLAKHCRKCAQGFEEDKIWESIYLAGKARGMMESWGLQLKRSSNKWALQHSPVTQE